MFFESYGNVQLADFARVDNLRGITKDSSEKK